MKIENTKAQMRKGVLELCILTLLGHEQAYASDLIEALKKSEIIVVEGTLYPLLTRLKNEGLLTYRWEESTGGPPRKYYALSPKGDAARAELEQSWRALVAGVNATLENTSQNTNNAKTNPS